MGCEGVERAGEQGGAEDVARAVPVERLDTGGCDRDPEGACGNDVATGARGGDEGRAER